MLNETLVSIDVNMSGVKSVRVMAYTPDIERRADKLYKIIKKHLNDIDQTLAPAKECTQEGARYCKAGPK